MISIRKCVLFIAVLLMTLLDMRIYVLCQYTNANDFEEESYYNNLPGQFENYDDNSSYNSQSSSTHWVDELLSRNDTLDFLASFMDPQQRNIVETQLRYCPYIPLCGFSFNLTHTIFAPLTCCKECSCAADCETSRSCCPDILTHLQANATHVVKEDIKPTCTSMYINNNNNALGEKKMLYSQCSEMSNQSLSTLCTRDYSTEIKHLREVVPVTDLSTNVTFRNKYCAFCMGVDELDMYFWLALFQCSVDFNTDKNIIQLALTDSQCGLSFYINLPSAILPEECQTFISECNVTGTWVNFDPVIERACAAYQSIIQTDVGYFRNAFCMLCNNVNILFTECPGDYGGEPIDFSFSGLLKFDRESVMVPSSPVDVCNETEFWDSYMKSCKTILCTDLLYFLINGKCESSYHGVKNIVYTFYIRLIPVKATRTNDAFHMATRITAWFLVFFSKKAQKQSEQLHFTLCSVNTISKVNIEFNQELSTSNSKLADTNILYYDSRFKIVVSYVHDPILVKQFFAEVELEKVSLPCDENETGDNSNSTLCYFTMQVHDDYRDIYDYVGNISKFNFTDYNVPSDTLAPFGMILPFISPDKKDGKTLVPNIGMNDWYSVCKVPAVEMKLFSVLPCPLVKVNKSDFPWEETSIGIRFTERRHELLNIDFHFDDDTGKTIRICLNDYQMLVDSQPSPKSLSLESMLSTICVSMSIISLLYTFVTFCLFSELRSVPGKNNMSLTLCLMLSHVFFLIGTKADLDQYSVACKCVGLAIHFFLLLSVFWMNICTFHTFRVFVSRNQTRSFDSVLKLECQYHTYAILASSALVLTNVVYSMVKSDSLDMGYGLVICYISSPKMQELTFGTPVAIVIFSNIVMFIIVVVKISRMPDVTKSVKHERNDIIIFAKLSTLTGLMWVFGFVYMWTDIVVFSYMFILLSGGQGVFIMISFGVNKRVRNLYKGRLTNITISNSTLESTTARTHSYQTEKM